MKLYKFVILIIVLLALAATSTYVLLTSDIFVDGDPEVNQNTVNAIKETVLQ